MEDFIGGVIVLGVFIVVIINFWQYILGIVILFTFFNTIRYYFEALKNFFTKEIIINNKKKEKTLIDFFNVITIMLKKFKSDNIETWVKLIYLPSIALLSLIHILISITIYLPYRLIKSLFYFIFNFFDKKYIQKHFVLCKFCNKKNPISLYKCSQCGLAHKNLNPSLEFGIFSHICKCGNKLPVYRERREQLMALCPNCKKNLIPEYSTLTQKKIISFIGSKDVGKTTYIIRILSFILKNYPNSKFIDINDKNTFDKNIIKIKQKLPVEKTYKITLFNILLDKERLLYFFDIPGDVFKKSNNIINEEFLSYSSMIILMIDPFAIKAIKEKYKNSYNCEPLIDTLSRLVEILEKQLNISTKNKINIPLHIIINKTDKIGEIDSDIERQLIKWGEEGFVQFLKVKFNNVKFYAFSILEDNEGIITKPINLNFN